ncbi:hypothetical protein GCM10008927_20630 [Amylibacter ulvae]|uniref:Uncharacterized protein n=1 Tax=Paramylibacter ulvae TaxID=1651968 RepID=A0ABQ3D4U9_9RHOB|nr:hypothetical protein GCM10008927_20630 [Amylibacter ulvae]
MSFSPLITSDMADCKSCVIIGRSCADLADLLCKLGFNLRGDIYNPTQPEGFVKL